MLLAAPCVMPAPAHAGDDIDPASFGPPTFEETFATFDWGEDQEFSAGHHRWRTVLGSGGPLSFGNRKGSATSIYVDPDFRGVSGGKLGPRPLGLDPFMHTPGMLQIRAQQTPEPLRPLLFDAPYMSGLITTKFSFAQLFGYFEAEISLPLGKGMWPAFWLLPTTGAWPQNGEIDIFEGLGESNTLYAGLISQVQKPIQCKVTVPFDVGSGVHRYGVLWTAASIRWYYDRKLVCERTTPADMTSAPMYMLLNLAVGGAWGGYPDATTPWPGVMSIRRVTAWLPPTAGVPVR